jgi:Tetratricopeptide repeat
MESAPKPRQRGRLTFLFKRKEKTAQTLPQITSLETIQGSSHHNNKESGDRQRSKNIYLKAAKSLEEVVNGCRNPWGSFDFPELMGEPENPTDLQFKHKINMLLEAQKSAVKDQSAWKKCKHTIQCVFSAFGKNFLTMATPDQSVSHCAPFIFDCIYCCVGPIWTALRRSPFIDHCTILTYLFDYVDCGESDCKERGISTYLRQGRMVEATELQEEALEKRKRILGEEHPHTLTTLL